MAVDSCEAEQKFENHCNKEKKKKRSLHERKERYLQ